MFHFLLQIDTSGLGDGSKTSMFELISSIGFFGIVVLLVIFVLSIVAVYIALERYFHISKAGKHDPLFMQRIKDFVASGNVAAAKDLCGRTNTPVARMIEKGVQRIGKSYKDISASIENVGNLEIHRLEKGLSVLATIAGAAPMLGFLGTVTGMINAFYDLSKYGNDIDQLSKGIYEAMITTAAGLAVGILAYIAYNLLVSMVQKVIFKMEASTAEFIDLLQEPSR